MLEATTAMQELWGYSAQDIISTVFRICKGFEMAEFLKMVFMREVGFIHMRIAEGTNSFCQLTGLLAKLVRIAREASLPAVRAMVKGRG
jgi:replication factor C subunit 2/4